MDRENRNTELKCEVYDLLKIIQGYQKTWVDRALVEAEKKAVQDYIAELKEENEKLKQGGDEALDMVDKLKAEITQLKGEDEEREYDDLNYEGVAYLHLDGIVYDIEYNEVGTLDRDRIDWTSYDACQRHKEDRDDTDEEEEVPVVPWRKLENTIHCGNDDAHKQTDKELFRLKVEGLTSAEIITKAKEHCETEGYGGFTYNRKNWNRVYFHKSIAAPRVINKDNAVSDGKTFTKWQWCDLYMYMNGYGER